MSVVDQGDGIPAWHEFLRPVLQVLSDGRTYTRRALEDATLDVTGVSQEQRDIELPTGGYKAAGRVGWSFSALNRATAVTRPAKGNYVITDLGRQLLKDFPTSISERDLMSLPAWDLYIPTKGKKTSGADTPETQLEGKDPAELIELAMSQVNANVASELLAKLRSEHPEFFEKAVVKLLIKMGYGGSEQRVQHLGRSNDGGVDGVIDQDALGLSRVFIQAKRYSEGNSIGRPDLQSFVGALTGKGALNGVFVTTSTFTDAAIDYVRTIQNRVVLIDGARLTELMIKYKVGVQTKTSFDIVELDEDFFD